MKNDKTLQTRPGDESAHELGSSPLPEGLSYWQASVSASYPDGEAPGWSQTAAAAGISATILRSGEHAELVSSVSCDADAQPFRAWLEARDGAVRVMVASRGPAYVFHLRALRNGRTVQFLGEVA